MDAFENPCVWIDVINRNFVHDYMKTTPCKDPTYIRNVKSSVERLLSYGVDVAIFHFEDFSTAVVCVAEIPFNKSLKKALCEAKDYLEDMIYDALKKEDPETINKFKKHLDRIAKFKNDMYGSLLNQK